MNRRLSASLGWTRLMQILFALALIYIAFVPSQSDFWHIIIPYAAAFLIYSQVISDSGSSHLLSWIALGVLIRFCLLFSFPNLSDDIYRFIWDGRLIWDGISPYAYLPQDLVSSNKTVTIDNELVKELNSPAYYSVYPPLSQIIFALAAIPKDWYLSAIIIKLFIFTAELGSLFFLYKILPLLKLTADRLLIYWLNPLIIIELMGNVHFEAFMVFFFLVGLYSVLRQRMALASLGLALSVGVKLVPLIVVQFFLPYLKPRKMIRFIIFLILGISISLLPLLLSIDLSHFAESLDLYFRRFEFNASIYYLARYVGYAYTGYNQIAYIGPLLSGLTVVLLLIYWIISCFQRDILNLLSWMLFAFCTYLFFSTTIHPWYLAMPILLSCFVHFRFAILWSGLIFLTYVNYSSDPYHESLIVVSIEYLLVFGHLIYELIHIPRAKLASSL